MIRVGTRVEHPRFGIGEVHQLEGTGSNIKATVLFPIGTKQLLLKFAKLRVIELIFVYLTNIVKTQIVK